MLTKKYNDILNLVLSLICIFFLLIYPMYCIEAAKDGLATALYIVLPSIFPFMVLSKFVISSGIYRYAVKFSGGIFEKLFGVSRQYTAVFILGCLGGYPIGSIILSTLLKKNEITINHAEHLAGICNNASPMFVIGTVGTLLLNNIHYGYILYAIHIFSVIVCGVVMKIIFNTKPAYISGNTYTKSFSPFSEAVTSSGATMLNIASYIIIFSVISKFVKLVFKDFDCSFILCLLEITTGIEYCASSNMPEALKIAMISSAIGFSGLCVFSQSRVVFVESNISFFKYFLAKTITAVLSFLSSYLIFTIIFSH